MHSKTNKSATYDKAARLNGSSATQLDAPSLELRQEVAQKCSGGNMAAREGLERVNDRVEGVLAFLDVDRGVFPPDSVDEHICGHK